MKQALPPILAGPVLRHVGAADVHLWLVTAASTPITLRLYAGDASPCLDRELSGAEHRRVRVGKHCVINLIQVRLPGELPADCHLQYDLLLNLEGRWEGLNELLPDLCYPGNTRPGCRRRAVITNILHGSCRKPHHPGPDALIRVDDLLGESQADPARHPDLLLFSGDQIYADDVAGPMLAAIHQVIEKLELFDERWQDAEVTDSRTLYACASCYYRRDTLLPRDKAGRQLLELFFRGASKPIFTAAGAHNHLVTLAEVIAMYLLVWSPACWEWVDLDRAMGAIPAQHRERYREERAAVENFAAGLGRVRRALAHVPVYMIFDDHDITDDWNLTRGWEEAAYSHPFSRRIIGNALIGYWLCQGWGNRPGQFAALEDRLDHHFSDTGTRDHDSLVDTLLDWEDWGYRLDTSPPVLVLDTRTRRWRSESSPSRPSGLMDWEALTEVQQALLGEESVILVSPPPIFGVKLIEAVQRVFSFFGKALMVDAENWMAHPGAANVLLNIFRHPKTPPHFVILSGDVHYSFVYDITLRHRRHSPRITQVTASGIKNTFPAALLRRFDRCNRWLYASRSPLNWFTKRRRMLIERRRPSHGDLSALYNGNGIGQVFLAHGGQSVEARILAANGQDILFRGASSETERE